MHSKSKLIVLSSPSGGGKSTIAAKLLAKHPGKLVHSISYTTRKPRGKETHGKDYFFVTDATFQSMIKDSAFLEYAQVFGKHWYGTSRPQVEGFLKQGLSVVFDIDVQGADSLKALYKKECVTIFILPPSFEELTIRLRARQTDDAAAIEARLNTARAELTRAPDFDHQVVNIEINTAVADVEVILKTSGAL